MAVKSKTPTRSTTVTKIATAVALGAVIVGVPAFSAFKESRRAPEVAVPDAPPARVEVGGLVLFRAQGRSVAWLVEPATDDYVTYGSQNNHFAGSFRSEGVYVIVAAAIVGGEVKVSRFPVTVGPHTPGNVHPEPTPLVSYIQAARPDDPDTAQRIAEAFRGVARRVEGRVEEMLPAEEIARMTEDAVRLAIGRSYSAWQAFMGGLRLELNAMAASGELVTPRDHVRVWETIAAVLES